jgi:hypothetical protein
VAQLNLDFEPGLTERYTRWEDTFTTAVYSCRKGLNGVALSCDQSPSELSKRLAWRKDNRDEPRPLRTCDVTDILDATQDFTPIYWLIERYLKDPEVKRNEAIAKLSELMPQLEALVQASAPVAVGRRR